jgi:hypothetical protein
MHGLPVRLRRTVRPRGLNTLPSASQTPSVTGGKAALTRLYALDSMSGVVTGRRPLTRDAKACLTAEETRNPNIPFGDSHPVSGGRRSTVDSERGQYQH